MIRLNSFRPGPAFFAVILLCLWSLPVVAAQLQTIPLPAGCGWTNTVNDPVLEKELEFSKDAVNSETWTSTNLFAIYVAEESKPVFIEATKVHYNETTHVFTLDATDAISEHKPLLAHINAVSQDLLNTQGKTKRSNDFLYNSVTACNAHPTIITGTDGSAKLNVTLTLGGGAYTAHFPYDVAVSYDSGTVVVSSDAVVAAQSELKGVDPVMISYTKGCAGCSLPVGGPPSGSYSLTPTDGNATITADGGLWIPGTLNAEAALQWGYLPASGDYAHSLVGFFGSGTMVVAGSCMPGTAQSSPEHLACALHLTGFRNQAGTLLAERPGSQAYANGDGDYAGMNLRCLAGSVMQAVSILGGAESDVYALTSRSKYVVRAGGVSGRHNAVDTGGSMVVPVYGYDCKFSSFGLAFLDNSNTDAFSGRLLPSRVAGSLYVPDPSNITIPFEKLNFNCVGGVTEFTPPASYTGDSLLAWGMEFAASRIRFKEGAGAECGTGNARLFVSLKARASFVPQMLFTELGFEKNGPLSRPVDDMSSPGRFPLPLQFTLPGPNGTSFELTACEGAYLNHLPPTATGGGYFNLAATVNVPFFEDIPVHLHVNARSLAAGGDVGSPYVMGGWPNGGFRDVEGGHFFNREIADAGNTGVPAGENRDVYRMAGHDGEESPYLPRALQTWIGGTNFDLPLKWNSSRHIFEGVDPVQQSLSVIKNADCRVTFITPQDTEIKFGKEYTLIPRISLANIAFDALADGLGVNASLEDAMDAVAAKLTSGVNALKRVSSEQAETFMGAALEQDLGGAAFTNLLNDMQNAGAGGDVQDVLDVVDAHLSTVGNGGAMTQKLFASIGLKNDVTPAVLTASAGDIQKGLDAIAGLVEENGGLLNSEVTRNLLQSLVEAFAPEFAGAISGADFSGAFGDAQAALGQIAEAFKIVKERLQEIKDAMEGGEFSQELKDLATAARPDIIAAWDAARVRIRQRVELAMARGGGVRDFTDAEWRQIILRELMDAAVTTTDYTGRVQATMRQRVSMAESAWRQVLDDLLAQFNGMLVKIITRSMPGFDSAFTDALDGLMATASVDGYAHMRGDSLAELRVNSNLKITMGKDMTFSGYFLVRDMRVTSPAATGGATAPADYYLVEAGTEKMPLDWTGLGKDVTGTIRIKLAFDTNEDFIGFGGGVELDGKMDNGGVTINKMTGSFMASTMEQYVSAAADMDMGSAGLKGGFFAGRTRSLEPLAMIDPFVADFLGQPSPTFTGYFQYAEGRVPLVNYTCAFRVSAGLGVGFFAFLEGPTLGGRIHAEVKGEALCTLSVKGDVDMVGRMTPDGFSYRGHGNIRGKAGWCPCCVRFRKSVTFECLNQRWNADY